jgi:hypothetical protein
VEDEAVSWIKIDDQFPDHPKVITAGPAAGWLYVCGLCYCGRYLTDGFIPSGQVRRLADLKDPQKLADALVSVGLWEVAEGGYQVHDYLDCGFLADPSIQDLRKTKEYKNWREAVLKRDGHRCVICGATDCWLHAHHIQAWARFPDQRFEPSNGITLCAPCHWQSHSGPHELGQERCLER